jgi:signal transduction histidine kinase
VNRPGSAQPAIELAPPAPTRPTILRSPALAILSLTAAIVVPLALLSILDAGDLRAMWDNLQWSIAAIGAALATVVSVRGSIGRVRVIRTAGAFAFGLATLANLSWAWLNFVGQATVPSIVDILIFAILLPWLFTIPASVRGRLSWADAAAVYIDSALITCLVATILILLHGSTALALPGGAGLVALAFPIGFIGLGGAGFIALLAAQFPITPRGQLAMTAGVAMIGFAYLGWVGPTVDGVAAGELPTILFTAGMLVGAFGVVTWRDERSDDPRYSTVARILTRAIGPTTAGLILMALLPRVSDEIKLIVDVAVFISGGLFLTRQALLLRERTTMLDEVTRLKLENDRLVGELRTVLAEHALDQRRMIQSSRAAAVGELAAGVAHEVNNPLVVVLGYAELLRDELDETDPRRADVDKILSHAMRARSIVRSLGDFARRGETTPVSTDVGDLLRRTVDLVRFPLTRRGVTIDERYAPLDEILVDPQAIQQAVINVIANAMQAVADDGRIEIETTGTENDVTIAVTDDGIGMTDLTASRAFEPFFSGQEFESDDFLATGLGLAVSRGLIEAHGGTITLSSGPGRGTRVELRLPIQRGPVAVGRGTQEGGCA